VILKRSIRRQRGEPEPSQYETKIVTRSGEARWIMLSVGLMKYRGKPAGVVTLFDITERRQAEEGLRLTQFAVDTSMDSSIWINVEGRLIYVNDATCRNLGYTREELLSMRIWDIDPGFTYGEFRKKWAALKENGSVKFESAHRRQDGSTFPVEVSSNYLKYRDQEYEVTFYRDITLHKRSEKELLDAKAQAELYLDLMGHDINNMNQALMGYLEMMDIMRESGAIDKTLIENSIEVINRSSRMIGDVKKLTRIQADKAPLKDVEVHKILSRVSSRYASVPKRSVTINYTPGDICIVRADDMFEDVFDNLVANAIRHSTGPVTVDITVDRFTLEGHGYYKISVTDTGPGMPDDLKKRIFMTMGETAVGEKSGRRGFGLYLVKTLVDRYGGQVWAEDRVRGDHTKGARFVVMLPVVDN
jgi:PAS domain S-box-containing protein